MILSDRFLRSFLLAHELHAEQTRKGSGIPYIGHLMGVASIVMEYGGDEDAVVAALLHDAVEDCGGLPVLERIRTEFGERVADIVDGCTDAYVQPKPPWIDRKTAYLAQMPLKNSETRLVSASDKLYNARQILKDLRDPEVGQRIWGRFNASRDQVLWYYRSLAEEFVRGGPLRLGEELNRTLSEIYSAGFPAR